MTRVFSVVAGLAFIMVTWGSPKANIVGSDHDFSASGWSGGQICTPCHVPHNANTVVADAPLWNHQVTAATYTTYSGSGTMNAVTGQPSGVSKLCLSCHDGTVAVDSFGGMTGSTFVNGGEMLGTNLSNDHPVSFTYDTALATADTELADPSSTPSGLAAGGTIAADMLFSGKMECASCHDVHNGNGLANLLVKQNNGSALCLTCHTK